MSNKSIGSREYKIMLKAEKFKGKEKELLKTAGKFWSDFKPDMSDFVIDTNGKLNEIKKRRTIRFYDTDMARLRNNNYVFRERTDLETGQREVTLKFRHPDRYLTQDRNMDAKKPKKGESKFEQDIKPPFLSLYSFSTKQEISSSKNLNKMNDPVGLFPDLENKLNNYQKDEQLNKVGQFTARELVITGADFQISASPKLEAECALIVWYQNKGSHTKPLLVEFSFKYESKDEDYDGNMAQRAYHVFMKLQKCQKWIDLKSMTKTAYVYGLASG
jgi:hypothetical protein